MNKKHLIRHRRRVYNQAIQVLIDRVSGKRSNRNIERTLEYVKYRADKLVHTKHVK